MNTFQIFSDKNVTPQEIADLLIAVGFDAEAAPENRQRVLDGYAVALERAYFIAHARDAGGKLIGLVSAVSGFAKFIELLLVHPRMRQRGVGKSLLAMVERQFVGQPVYVTPFDDQRDYFIKQGYKISRRPMIVLFKPNGMNLPTLELAA